MTAVLVCSAGAALAAALVLVLRGRRRAAGDPAEAVASPYADAPASLTEAKLAFERANAKLLAAQEAWRAAADEVTATGAEMTAVYQQWATGRAATALEQNGGRRASVFDRLDHLDELVQRPIRPAEQ